jgi:hypothetical protein
MGGLLSLLEASFRGPIGPLPSGKQLEHSYLVPFCKDLVRHGSLTVNHEIRLAFLTLKRPVNITVMRIAGCPPRENHGRAKLSFQSRVIQVVLQSKGFDHIFHPAQLF